MMRSSVCAKCQGRPYFLHREKGRPNFLHTLEYASENISYSCMHIYGIAADVGANKILYGIRS